MTMRKKIADWLFGAKNPGQEDADQQQAIADNARRISEHISRLFNDLPDVALFASDSIARLVAACSAEELLQLDEDVRWLYDWNAGRKWIELQPDDISKLPVTKQSRGAVLGIASFHANGHVREAAVRQLNDVDDGTELPFLLIRNNDWVAKVQQSARAAVEQRVRQGRFDFSARNLYLLFRLLDKQRAEHSELVALAVHQLVQPKHRAMLLEALGSSDRYIRRNVFRLSMATSGIDLAELIRVGTQSSDEVIRLWAIRQATTVFKEQDLDGLLAQAKHDAFLPVRREVLNVRLERFPKEADEYLRFVLIDRSPSVRELARFYLRKRGVTDLVRLYQDKLKTGEIDVAIAGIGETGERADADYLVRYFRAFTSRERQAAVRAVGQLAASEFIESLVERLSDDSPRVSQEAARWLGDHVFNIGAPRLWALFQKDDRQHVKLCVLKLMDKFSIWHKLPYLIEAAAHPEHRIAAFAIGRTERLRNRVFTHPSAVEQQQIHQALDNYHDSLPSSFRDSVQHWVVAMSRN